MTEESRTEESSNARRLGGVVAGGVFAGLVLTAMMMAGERKSGKPSEIVDLERKSAQKLGLSTPPTGALPSDREQVVAQGGHLLLSAVAGATYAATTDEDTSVIGSGLAFGAVFYAAMHWIAGPMLGVKQPEWRSDAKTIGLHTVNHLAFGLITALGARLARAR